MSPSSGGEQARQGAKGSGGPGAEPRRRAQPQGSPEGTWRARGRRSGEDVRDSLA
jgi:hypothetical protein